MARRNLRQRLVDASLAGRYEAYLGVGLGLAVLGLILFALAVRGPNAARAWQLFHVNWVYFTGLCAGSIAFAAVHKITNARWSGMVIRLAEAAAGEGYVNIIGANVARQVLEAGRLDEVLTFVVPVLLGDGVRLFDHPGGTNVRLETLRVVQSPMATALWYRVVGPT